MFRPNTKGWLERRSGYTIDGVPNFTEPKEVPCAIVHLIPTEEKTSVRTDSSASRGAAEEVVGNRMKILFPVSVKPAAGDRFVIYGAAMRLISIEPRIAVNGRLDHYEAQAEMWV
jgi:hypothetical protein